MKQYFSSMMEEGDQINNEGDVQYEGDDQYQEDESYGEGYQEENYDEGEQQHQKPIKPPKKFRNNYRLVLSFVYSLL